MLILVLFVGILHLFYALWDFLDERLFIKENGSDCSQFAKVIGWSPSCESLATRFGPTLETLHGGFPLQWLGSMVHSLQTPARPN